jgi:acetylornithine deacetylase/succinyl-diaminopimelate desuccinylase-like protein
VSTFQNRLNVPGVAAPGNPFYFGAKVHAPNEHVKLEDVGHAARFTYALLEALGQAPPE